MVSWSEYFGSYRDVRNCVTMKSRSGKDASQHRKSGRCVLRPCAVIREVSHFMFLLELRNRSRSELTLARRFLYYQGCIRFDRGVNPIRVRNLREKREGDLFPDVGSHGDVATVIGYAMKAVLIRQVILCSP